MLEAVSSLVVATMLLLGSPGPATLALAATGAVFGFRGGTPFLIGILSGLAVAIVLGSAGIVALFEAFPASRFFCTDLRWPLYLLCSSEDRNRTGTFDPREPKWVGAVVSRWLHPQFA